MNQNYPEDHLVLAQRYRTTGLLGQGVSGRTWLAIDEHFPSSLCVIKQIWTGAAYSFTQMQDLSHPQLHPDFYLPRWLDEIHQDGVTYWIQEFVLGQNLAIALAEKGSFEPTEVGQILAELLPMIQWIHDRGIIHGDIKPENIIRTPAGNWVLVAAGTIGGNPAYAAPEQLRGEPEFASDLYSLGVVGIHLLTGTHPFHWLDAVTQENGWQAWLPENSTPLHWKFQALVNLLDRLIVSDPQNRLNEAGAIAELRKCQHFKPVLYHPRVEQKEPTWVCDRTLVGHSGLFAGVNGIAFASDDRMLASVSDDKTIRIWDLQTGQGRLTLGDHLQFVKTVAFHPQDPQILISGSSDRTIKQWDLQTQRVMQTFTGHTHTVNAVVFSPDGHLLISGSSDKTVRLWDATTGEFMTALKGHQLAVNALALHFPFLATASSDSTVCLWNLETLTKIHTLVGHTAAVKAIAFSPGGQCLATGGDDRTIRLWDLTSGQCSRILPGHSWSISALTFAAQGELLMSGSWDKMVKLWQMKTGKAIETLVGHADAVNCVAIAADQRWIASGSADRTIKLWRNKR